MTFHLAIDSHDVLVVSLREGDVETSVSVTPSASAMTTLERAMDDALETSYGECFWPAFEGGQYWWIFSRRADALETIVMWTRGGASLWEHVFRATDEAAWVRQRWKDECRRAHTALRTSGL
jgi:hypothetical protein